MELELVLPRECLGTEGALERAGTQMSSKVYLQGLPTAALPATYVTRQDSFALVAARDVVLEVLLPVESARTKFTRILALLVAAVGDYVLFEPV